jgi:hypothetical protein
MLLLTSLTLFGNENVSRGNGQKRSALEGPVMGSLGAWSAFNPVDFCGPAHCRHAALDSEITVQVDADGFDGITG